MKKAGIIGSETDIRRAKPWWSRKAGPRGGYYTLHELVDKYDPIISGKATAVKLSPEKTREYKRIGFETTKQGRIIVPHSAVEKVKVTPKGDYYTTDLKGIRRIPVAVPYHNLEQYLQDLKAKDRELQAMRGKGRYFAFRFFGGHSAVYANIDQLLDDLSMYEAVTASILATSARDMNEVYRNLEIVEVTKSAWETSKDKARAIAKAKRKKKPGERKRALENAKKQGAFKLQIYRAKRAESERKRRAKKK